MYRTQDSIIEKEQVHVELEMADKVVQGIIYVGGQERVFDLLNKSDPFLALEVDGVMKFVNKCSISMMRADDADRMGMQPERRNVREFIS